jgi:hypothetical protein
MVDEMEGLLPQRARINASVDDAVNATELIPDGTDVTVEIWKIQAPADEVLAEWPDIPDSVVFRVIDSGVSIDGKLINYSLNPRGAGMLVKASAGRFAWTEDGYSSECIKMQFQGVVSLVKKVSKKTGEDQEFNRIKITL